MAPTVRILAGAVPDADWVAYASGLGARFVTGDQARQDCAAEREQELARPASGHGYARYANGDCRCDECRADWRQASGRYRHTGRYAAAL